MTPFTPEQEARIREIVREAIKTENTIAIGRIELSPKFNTTIFLKELVRLVRNSGGDSGKYWGGA